MDGQHIGGDRAAQIAAVYDQGWRDAVEAACERVVSAGSFADAVARVEAMQQGSLS